MNKKGNQRYQETCQRIEDAMVLLLDKKTADQITVSEVCREAGVHRTTFYGHYKDIPNLMNHMANRIYKSMLEGFTLAEEETAKEGFLRLFCMIQENQKLYRCLMEYYGFGHMEFGVLPPGLVRHIEKLQEKYKEADRESIFYHHIFFSEGLKAVLYRWLLRECKETPEQMWEIISREYAIFDKNNHL